MFTKGNYWIKKALGYTSLIFIVLQRFLEHRVIGQTVLVHHILSHLKIMCDKYLECTFKKYSDYLRAIFIKYILSFSGSRSKIDANYPTLVGKFSENAHL